MFRSFRDSPYARPASCDRLSATTASAEPRGQIDLVNQALAPAVADGTVAGIGLWEITLSRGAESNTDHAAKWETSNSAGQIVLADWA